MCISRSAAAGLGLLSACAVPASAVAQDEASVLAGSCTSCHGVADSSQSTMPPLAGPPRTVLEAQLATFKAGDDPNSTIMSRIAAGYSDDELAALARYFADLTTGEKQ